MMNFVCSRISSRDFRKIERKSQVLSLESVMNEINERDRVTLLHNYTIS